MRLIELIVHRVLCVCIHSVHFSETKDFCEIFRIMKFCAIVLCTCTGSLVYLDFLYSYLYFMYWYWYL